MELFHGKHIYSWLISIYYVYVYVTTLHIFVIKHQWYLYFDPLYNISFHLTVYANAFFGFSGNDDVGVTGLDSINKHIFLLIQTAAVRTIAKIATRTITIAINTDSLMHTSSPSEKRLSVKVPFVLATVVVAFVVVVVVVVQGIVDDDSKQ